MSAKASAQLLLALPGSATAAGGEGLALPGTGEAAPMSWGARPGISRTSSCPLVPTVPTLSLPPLRGSGQPWLARDCYMMPSSLFLTSPGSFCTAGTLPGFSHSSPCCLGPAPVLCFLGDGAPRIILGNNPWSSIHKTEDLRATGSSGHTVGSRTGGSPLGSRQLP